MQQPDPNLPPTQPPAYQQQPPAGYYQLPPQPIYQPRPEPGAALPALALLASVAVTGFAILVSLTAGFTLSGALGYLVVFGIGGIFLALAGGFVAQGFEHRSPALVIVGVLVGAAGLAAPILLWLSLLVGNISNGFGR